MAEYYSIYSGQIASSEHSLVWSQKFNFFTFKFGDVLLIHPVISDCVMSFIRHFIWKCLLFFCFNIPIISPQRKIICIQKRVEWIILIPLPIPPPLGRHGGISFSCIYRNTDSIKSQNDITQPEEVEFHFVII